MPEHGTLGGVTDIEQLVPAWLNLPEVAEALDLPITRVHSLISDRSLVSIRIGERRIRSVPAEFLLEGSVLDSLRGTVVVLADSGFQDEDIIRWLYTEDESLPGRPIDALRNGRKTEIRRRAQAAAW
ncbi:DNA-binding protein [Arthrobacter echini]|uniref:DNA-binding protein n=1 Tax=Arthrobacter echini TaxID=1529066 RepID=A0A5D0XQA1_9MICC|nr:DNA-binding protein [Arthrobacter echini]